MIPHEIPLACLSHLATVLLACAAAAGRAPARVQGEPATRVEAVRAEPPEARAFLDLEAERRRVFVQQPIRLRLRFGFDEEFLRARMVQPFRRELDVPAQIQAPWLEGLPGATPLPPAPPEHDGERERLSFALGEGVAEALAVGERTLEGRTFAVLEAELAFLPERPGELVFAEPTLRFAYATHFRAGPFGGRAPVDRNDALVRGNAVPVEVLPLPEEGRPVEFSGAVGRFEVSAEAKPREVWVGEGLELVLEITGEGNLASLGPPRLDRLAGFHLRGTIDSKERGVLRVIYDLAPRSAAVREIPAIPFAFFDPGPPAGYRTSWTRPIPIEVRPERVPEAPPAVEAPSGRSAGGEPETPLPGFALNGTAVAALLAGALFVVLALWILLRVRLARSSRRSS